MTFLSSSYFERILKLQTQEPFLVAKFSILNANDVIKNVKYKLLKFLKSTYQQQKVSAKLKKRSITYYMFAKAHTFT